MDYKTLQNLRFPCTAGNPVGSNLEYAPDFLEMVRLSEKRPELQYGPTIIESKEPPWQLVYQSCLDLASKTRDLRVGVRLVDTLCHLDGWNGLAEGLELITDWSTKYWDTIHPQLDPDDAFDPTARLGILSHLTDNELLIQSIHCIPLVEHRSMGQVTLRDWVQLFHSAEVHSSCKLTRSDVEAIFLESNRNVLEQRLGLISRCIAASEALDRFLKAKVGMGLWSGNGLVETLVQIRNVFESHFAERGHPFVSLAESCHLYDRDDMESSTLTDVQTQPVLAVDSEQHSVESKVGQPSAWTMSKVATRTDAAAAIDSICSYFETNEPASPVPLLLQRAKRLIPMSFIEILRELAPNEENQLLQNLSYLERLNS